MFKLPNGCDFLTEQQASPPGRMCCCGLDFPVVFEDKTHLLAWSGPSMWILGCPCFQGMKVSPVVEQTGSLRATLLGQPPQN